MSSEKSSIIIKVVLLSVLAVVLVGVMLFFMFSRWAHKRLYFSFGDFGKSELQLSEVYSKEQIKKMNFSLVSADIDVKYSNSDEIKLEIYDKDDKSYNVSLTDGMLDLDFSKVSRICIGFCYSDRRVVMYLPEEFQGNIDVSTASGEVDIESFVNSDIKVTTASGDVEVKGASKVSVSTASGEAILKDIPNVNVKTISGDISVSNVQTLEGSSVSGSVYVNNLKGSIDFKTTSGDYELDNIYLDKSSRLSSVSGEVEINGINPIYVSTSTISGDARVNTSDRKSDIELNIKTTSGDIEVN